MTRGVLLIAAVAGELKGLVRSWKRLPRENGVEAWRHHNRPIVALCGGMGAAAATRAFSRGRQLCLPTRLYSVGWAGSLAGESRAGEVSEAGRVLDTQTGELFDLASSSRSDLLLLTTARVADREEKRRLHERYPTAALVDMEAAALARLALAHGIPFHAIKAVSDTPEDVLPDLNPFINHAGQFATARFAAYAAVRPRLWRGLVRFGRNAGVAAERLTEALLREIDSLPPGTLE